MAPSRNQVGGRFWIIPAEIYEPLNARYGPFDFDPCPYPLPEGFCGIAVEWGERNWVNPPFHKADSPNGQGPTAFVRRAIEMSRRGKSSFLTLPTQSYVNLLLEAGAVPLSLGRIKWLEAETREPMAGPSPITGFWLPGQGQLCLPVAGPSPMTQHAPVEQVRV